MTRIEWVLNPDGTRGITVNSKTGCLNHDNGLCKGGGFPCYAYKLSHGRLKQRYLANKNYITWRNTPVDFYDDKDKGGQFYKAEIDAPFNPFYPRWWPERLDKIRSIKKPTGIFPDDMSDWMGDYWPEEWTRQELQLMRDCPQHRFYTLTKQPQNLPQWEFPENCWVGVTATDGAMAWTAMCYLEKIESKVKYISFEPLLGDPQVELPIWQAKHQCDYLSKVLTVLDWLIIGACTGTQSEMLALDDRYNLANFSRVMPLNNRLYTFQPKIESVREIVEAADKAGIPVFLKDNLKPLFEQVYGTDIHSDYYHNGLRQEMPNCPGLD